WLVFFSGMKVDLRYNWTLLWAVTLGNNNESLHTIQCEKRRRITQQKADFFGMCRAKRSAAASYEKKRGREAFAILPQRRNPRPPSPSLPLHDSSNTNSRSQKRKPASPGNAVAARRGSAPDGSGAVPPTKASTTAPSAR